MAQLILLPGKERSAFKHHPWLFAGSVGRLEGRARPGDTVEVLADNLRPLGRAVAVAKSVSEGQLDNDVSTSGTDETGMLLQSMGAMQSTLVAFNAAQQEMARRHNDLGEISYQMPAGEFAGAFGDMARNVNGMVGAQSAMNSRLVELIGQYVKGNFEGRMDALPGEKERITAAAEGAREQMAAADAAARYNARVKAALDNVSLPVRIAADDGTIIYINNALRDTLRRDEAGFRKQIPGFDPEKVLNNSIGIFYADPPTSLARLRNLNGTPQSRLELEPLPQHYLLSAWTPHFQRLPYEYDRRYQCREQMQDLHQDHLQACERLE